MEYKSIAKNIAIIMIMYNTLSSDSIVSVKGLILWSLIYLSLRIQDTGKIVDINITHMDETPIKPEDDAKNV